MEHFRSVGLWRRTLGADSPEVENDPLSIIRSAYITFRERAAHLTAHISKSLPELTIHDISHLDALWETADLIAGAEYPFNPAEAFVFGGAVLVHDAALCFEAYQDGKRGLRETIEWKDALAAIQAKHSTHSDRDNTAEADFVAMRSLHASRAADLANLSWDTPEGERLFLIESHELRKHYGQLIGTIAASHHWPIEDILSKMPGQVNAPASFPREWRVDPIKVACLLRCADAAHLDGRRAPDFLRALAPVHGVSAQHWTAQNWLERADSDVADPARASIIFTSGRPFDEENANAWWVAYDAVRLVDKELASAASLLEQRPQSTLSPPFQMRKVTGADSPAAASKYITTVGWTPRAVEIHVSNLERLISELGGSTLYGNAQPVVVALRELIQNARDAIVARRSLDKDYVGKIRISISRDNDIFCISVEDDGVGMAYRVVTGALLDFGSSFWTSDLVKSEFPGLLSAGYKSVGKFGVGFYSVFMVASAVSVATRRFDAGLDKVTQVRFPNGLSLRPLISSGPPNNFGFSTSTLVKLFLKPEMGSPLDVLITPGRTGYEPDIRMSMRRILSILCAGLDVIVELGIGLSSPEIVHRPLWEVASLQLEREWLLDISADDLKEKGAMLEEHVARLRPIKNGNDVFGMAALSTTRMPNARSFATISTVGGLAHVIGASDLSRFVGCVDFRPNSARREPSTEPSAGRVALENWAFEQTRLLPPRESDPLAWCFATCSLADLQCDPIDIATILIRDGDTYSISALDDVVRLIVGRGLAFYQSNLMPHVETYHNLASFEGVPTFWPVTHSSFLSLRRDQNGVAEINSILSCIDRRAEVLGFRISSRYAPSTVRGHFGALPVLLLAAEDARAAPDT